jgi:hypothetical protein
MWSMEGTFDNAAQKVPTLLFVMDANIEIALKVTPALRRHHCIARRVVGAAFVERDIAETDQAFFNDRVGPSQVWSRYSSCGFVRASWI